MASIRAVLRGSFLALLLIAAAAPAGAIDNDTVRIVLNPGVLGYLPLFVAIDKGYFTGQHINLDIKTTTAASSVQLPVLARGDLDIDPMAMSAGFFNQYAAGFDLKLIASVLSPHPGWNDSSWIVVRQDVWDSGAVRKLADLRGKIFDGATPGEPPNMLANEALAQAGLTRADLKYSERIQATNQSVALQNHAIDVGVDFEPAATQLESQHIAHKWLALRDLMPWYQASFLATSTAYLQTHRDVVRRFLVAYLEAARDIARSNGHWTPELLAIAAKYTQIPRDVLLKMSGPEYCDPGGTISAYSLDRQEQYFIEQGLVPKAIAPSSIIDAGPLLEARQALALRAAGKDTP